MELKTTYHHWTVLELFGHKNGKKLWKCRCVCGAEKNIDQHALTSGKSKSCGCQRRENLKGKSFGKLTAIQPVVRGDGTKVWFCTCECGGDALVRAQSLKEGHTQSCGCIRQILYRDRFLESVLISVMKELTTSCESLIKHAEANGELWLLEELKSALFENTQKLITQIDYLKK